MPSMSAPAQFQAILAKLQAKIPAFWLNDRLGQPLPADAPSTDLIADAEARMASCAPLLAELFPELNATGGNIESALMPADKLKAALSRDALATPAPGSSSATMRYPLPVRSKRAGGFMKCWRSPSRSR